MKQDAPCFNIESMESDTELRMVTFVMTDEMSLILWQMCTRCIE